ncbi:MAG: tRNA (guanosine(46)-N7)-methyltransferase TrmB [Shewanellaceae bacterium]|nr:tRNA (guanosine(46)-N7)-methyltransferase TrmB [Shewanellaceae bacterium]
MSNVLTSSYTEDGKYIKKIQSFVLREGRMTKGQRHAIANHWQTYGIDYQVQPLDFIALFGRKAPVVLEIGFGMGDSLVAMAQAAPEKDFIGIEVHQPGVGACIQQAVALELSNLKVIHHDAVEVLENMIAVDSVAGLQLFFADPWHKKRHHKRRLVQTSFIELVHTKLAVQGFFHLATDWHPYAVHMLEVFAEHAGYENQSVTGDFIVRPPHRPMTKFEKRGQRLEHGVWDLLYQKAD